MESDCLEALADGQEQERWEIPLVVRPDDMLESTSASTGLERHGELHLEM